MRSEALNIRADGGGCFRRGVSWVHKQLFVLDDEEGDADQEGQTQGKGSGKAAEQARKEAEEATAAESERFARGVLRRLGACSDPSPRMPHPLSTLAVARAQLRSLPLEALQRHPGEVGLADSAICLRYAHSKVAPAAAHSRG